jgi:hypothetical protein
MTFISRLTIYEVTTEEDVQNSFKLKMPITVRKEEMRNYYIKTDCTHLHN